MAKQATAPRRPRRASFTFQFILMLISLGLATALAAGGVASYETQNARAQQLLQTGTGAARLAFSLVRLETATVSSDLACQLAALPQTALAFAAGDSALTAEAAADSSTAPSQVLLFAGPENQLLAQSPSAGKGALPQALLAGAVGPSRYCSGRQGRGLFLGAGGRIYGGGAALVVRNGRQLGKVVALTPVSSATLGFATDLVDTTGATSTVLLDVDGASYTTVRLAGEEQAQGEPLPSALTSALRERGQVGEANLQDGQDTVAGQPLHSADGRLLGTVVVVQSPGAIGPTVGQLAIPLALAVAAILLIGLVLVFLLTEHYLNRPLRRLNSAVQRLGQDAYADPVSIDGAEEVTRLAANFEIMRRQLRRQLLMATGRTVIASTLTGNAPLEQALSQVLLSLVNLLEADFAMILLRPTQPSGHALLISCGLPEHALDWSELESSEGILGRLTREPRFLIRSHLATKERSSLERRIGLRDCLAEPLRAEGRDLGILVIANKRRPYLEEDTALCNAVADQVVAAVDKSIQLAATQREATTDAMTGLYNYRFLISYLDQQVNVAERASAALSVLMLDLDHFKAVNDSFGHPVGDRVLRTFAALVLDTIRKSDLAARYGGEEFVVVMANTTGEDARLVAEKIRLASEGMEVPLEDGGVVRLTVSIGGVTFPDGTKGARNLLDLADRALYAAKRAGRNRVEFLDAAVVLEKPSPS